jgi:hypothetical protein
MIPMAISLIRTVLMNSVDTMMRKACTSLEKEINMNSQNIFIPRIKERTTKITIAVVREAESIKMISMRTMN